MFNFRLNVVVATVASLVVLMSSPAESVTNDITIVPTVPPGIFSFLTNSGSSAINSKTGTLTLGGNSTTFLYSSLLLIPLLIGVVILDFGIFGAYATRREELNPFSEFVFRVRDGLNVVRARKTESRYDSYKNRFSAADRCAKTEQKKDILDQLFVS